MPVLQEMEKTQILSGFCRKNKKISEKILTAKEKDVTIFLALSF